MTPSKTRVGIVNATDFSPFGVQLDGRTIKNDFYRYSMNGMEADDEIKGNSNSYDFGNRMQDPRIGRFLSVDKFSENFAQFSPYSFAGNTPIWAMDTNGDSVWVYTETIDASYGIGRHTFMRVKTTDIDVVIELYGPDDNSNNKGRPQVNEWNSGTLNRSEVMFHQVYEPVNESDPDKFEKDLLKYAEHIKGANVVDDKGNITDNPILPPYDKWGPNSNGYVISMIKYAGGDVDILPFYSDFPLVEIVPGLNDIEDYLHIIKNAFGAEEYYQNNYGMSQNEYNKQKMEAGSSGKQVYDNSATPADNTKVNNTPTSTKKSPAKKTKKKSS